MKKKSLLTTNVYLKNRVKRERMLRRTVITSSAVEGVDEAATRALQVPAKLKDVPSLA